MWTLTYTGTPLELGGRAQRDASTSRRAPKTVAEDLTCRGAWSRFSERQGPAQAFISGFWPPDVRTQVLLPERLCGFATHQRKQTTFLPRWQRTCRCSAPRGTGLMCGRPALQGRVPIPSRALDVPPPGSGQEFLEPRTTTCAGTWPPHLSPFQQPQ